MWHEGIGRNGARAGSKLADGEDSVEGCRCRVNDNGHPATSAGG